MKDGRHTCCERETSRSPTSFSRRGRHALLCPAAMRLPTATAVSMTTAVTTKVARNLPRSPNFQDLARGEFKMWRGHGARGLARRRAHVHFSLLHVGRPLVVHADGGGYLPS